jgi:hypothetical protein
MAYMTIEFKKPTASEWDFLGRFTATPVEISELRALLEGLDDPYEVLDQIEVPIVRDALCILRDDGLESRVAFKEDH